MFNHEEEAEAARQCAARGTKERAALLLAEAAVTNTSENAVFPDRSQVFLNTF